MLQDPKIKSGKICRQKKQSTILPLEQSNPLPSSSTASPPEPGKMVTQLGFYHLLCLPTLSFNLWLPSRTCVVTLLLQVLWWNTAPLSLLSLLELRISLLKKNTSRSSPDSLEKQGREQFIGVYLMPSLLKYKHLLCACLFSVPVFVIQESFVTSIKCRSTEEQKWFVQCLVRN